MAVVHYGGMFWHRQDVDPTNNTDSVDGIRYGMTTDHYTHNSTLVFRQDTDTREYWYLANYWMICRRCKHVVKRGLNGEAAQHGCS